MELCLGGELHETFAKMTAKKEKKDCEKMAAVIMKDLLSALMHIHSLNIIHRDIKPENIMFDKEEEGGTAKFIDFGLAC